MDDRGHAYKHEPRRGCVPLKFLPETSERTSKAQEAESLVASKIGLAIWTQKPSESAKKGIYGRFAAQKAPCRFARQIYGIAPNF